MLCPTCQNHFENAVFCPRDGTPLIEEEDRSGQVLGGRYELVGKVGQGGMGDVYSAVMLETGVQVAVKLLRTQSQDFAQNARRLAREAQAAGAIGHPGIVTIIDFGESPEGAVFLVMEWLAGRTLEAVLRAETVTTDRALSLMADVCDALAAAHATGVIHRDVKPGNIFVIRDAVGTEAVKLVDFGIAKVVRDQASITKTGTFVGTPDYVAPEQALGEEVDARADIYSVGVILYELFAGRLPFTSGSIMAILEQHITEPPPAPCERNPDRHIPAVVEDIILRCMAKEPAGRFATATELRDTLRKLIGTDWATAARAVPRNRPPSASAPPVSAESASGITVSSRALPPAPDASLALLRPASNLARMVTALVLVCALLGVGLIVLIRSFRAGAEQARDSATGWAQPPPHTEWQHAGEGDGFSYALAISPTPVAPGAPFTLRLSITAAAPALRAAVTAGEARARIDVTSPTGAVVFTEVREVTLEGHLATPITAVLEDAGTHQIQLTVSATREALGRASFNMCVGADPFGDPAEVARTCPNLHPR